MGVDDMSNKVYDILKTISLMCLPAIATLYAVLAGIWNLPFPEQIPATITAINACLGAFLGISSAKYNKTEDNE